ncbi:hypothetical protein [Seohaeicola zhoushanensis]|uniref:Thioesterase domain-containing protein n=1 Tax=Seohaeicola zhoushanensis TaxID=1569283 RepID=A0A8J3M9Z4_9RHOB|nr:hypothetical protein [Seohaeicola zhoushanensis]GHF65343.1 hypothetical protein GCM10017056_40710 [Seohaeicola zhoushanensis]
MITFEDFEPGRSFGSVPVTLDDRLWSNWTRLYPGDSACAPEMPEGMTAVLVMKAYMELVAPRPPGNVHASQSFEVTRLPRLGETVTTTVTCTGKELRNGRRWIDLATESRDAEGQHLFNGRMRMIWAA